MISARVSQEKAVGFSKNVLKMLPKNLGVEESPLVTCNGQLFTLEAKKWRISSTTQNVRRDISCLNLKQKREGWTAKSIPEVNGSRPNAIGIRSALLSDRHQTKIVTILWLLSKNPEPSPSPELASGTRTPQNTRAA